MLIQAINDNHGIFFSLEMRPKKSSAACGSRGSRFAGGCGHTAGPKVLVNFASSHGYDRKKLEALGWTRELQGTPGKFKAGKTIHQWRTYVIAMFDPRLFPYVNLRDIDGYCEIKPSGTDSPPHHPSWKRVPHDHKFWVPNRWEPYIVTCSVSNEHADDNRQTPIGRKLSEV